MVWKTPDMPRSVVHSDEQLRPIWNFLNSGSEGKNLLVFGLVQDMDFWVQFMKPKGKTLFVTEESETLVRAKKDVVHVEYKTVASRDFERYMKKETWPELLLDLPNAVKDSHWHAIVIDAPDGCCYDKSILEIRGVSERRRRRK